MIQIMNLFKKNLPAKIIALFVAMILWFFVMNEQNPSIEGSFTVPLTVLHAPSGCKLTQSEDTIKIKLRGPRSAFVGASREDFKAFVDLEGLEEGRQIVRVQTVLPPGFELAGTSPETVVFVLDKIIQRQEDVNLIITGAAAPGATVAKVSPEMTKVMVEGPRTAVNDVSQVVGYVGLAGNNADFTLNVSLSPVNADGRGVDEVRVIPQTISTGVQLARGLTKKIVSVKPIFAGDLPAGYAVSGAHADPVKIEIAGDAAVLENITALDTEKISLADVTKSVRKAVLVHLPDGVTVTNKTVVVSIDVIEKK
jgi:YbbR domain-containing protein